MSLFFIYDTPYTLGHHLIGTQMSARRITHRGNLQGRNSQLPYKMARPSSGNNIARAVRVMVGDG
jgi:hypothetical protein